MVFSKVAYSSKIEGNLIRDLPRYLLPNRRIPRFLSCSSIIQYPVLHSLNQLKSSLLSLVSQKGWVIPKILWRCQETPKPAKQKDRSSHWTGVHQPKTCYPVWCERKEAHHRKRTECGLFIQVWPVRGRLCGVHVQTPLPESWRTQVKCCWRTFQELP